MKFVLMTLGVLLITACVPNNLNNEQKFLNKPINQTSTAKMVKHPQDKDATPAEIAECQKQGGKISKQGLLRHDFCVVEFADKGKVCTDGSDCQAGRCIADNSSTDSDVGTPVKGICPSNNVPFGCYGTVNQGKFAGFLCVD